MIIPEFVGSFCLNLGLMLWFMFSPNRKDVPAWINILIAVLFTTFVFHVLGRF